MGNVWNMIIVFCVNVSAILTNCRPFFHASVLLLKSNFVIRLL